MSSPSKRSLMLALTAGLAVCMFAALSGLTGCGSDQSKQDFVNGVLSIIEENQSQTEIAQEGQAAFTAYYQSGFTDLESAAAAAESFVKSNDKDELSLQELEALEKPDEAAQGIVDVLVAGIETMDDGNSVYVEELAKAPEQSVEERSQVFVAAGQVMGIYIEGISAIIVSCDLLLDYVQTNGLDGEEKIQSWHDKFQAEKENLEQALESMSAS
ncbi:MAG: hypothetical protein JW854_08155 [Actinobacteria bacterium]|nr:hypothetical protein [Actinomycetota bacterium]